RWSSPAEVCLRISEKNLGGGLISGSGYLHSKISETQWLCDFRTDPPRASFYISPTSTRYYANRYGNTCPPDTEYNSETGECVEPPKECVEGELFPARGASSPIQTSDSGSWIPSVPPSGMCYQSCSYAGVQGETRATGCYKDPADETMGYCNYIIKGTGESCSTENYQIAVSGEPLNSAPPSEEPPPTICPPGWGLSGNTCFKLPETPCDPSTGEICGPPGDDDGKGDDGKGDDGKGDGDTGGGGG